MECSACAFAHQLQRRRFSAPCNSCNKEQCDKGYCLAAESDGVPVPLLMKIHNRADAMALMRRAREQGTPLSLYRWSAQRHGYCPVKV